MKIAITILIIIGIAIMISNIVRYAIFLHTTHDVLSSGSKRDRSWKTTALILLIFFLIGYIFIVIASKPDLMMAMILFGGSIFVAIVLTLMFNLLETAKERSIDIADTYSAITMRRSYKEPRTHEDAVRILKEAAGTQLDADLVEYFLKIPKEELEICIPEQVKY